MLYITVLNTLSIQLQEKKWTHQKMKEKIQSLQFGRHVVAAAENSGKEAL